MKVLHLADRLSQQGGADQHLRDVCAAQRLTHRVTLAFGSQRCREPTGVHAVKVRGLAGKVASHAGLSALPALLGAADVVHVHNVMNPVALQMACATGRAVVTVQDHRVFCPGPGKTLPDGTRCSQALSSQACAGCFDDSGYAERSLALTRQRLEALRGAALVLVLSSYMAAELDTLGVPSQVLPPWVELGEGAPDDERSGYLLGGRLVHHKAPLEAVQAWQDSGTEEPLRIAGAGPLEKHIPGEHLGWLPRSELHRWLGVSRALLFPARWQEPFGILGLEALAQGTPVISWRRGGVEAWAQAGCILVDGPEEAIDAIGRIDADPRLRSRLGTEGRALVSEHFGRRALLARLEDAYRRLRCRTNEMEEPS